jgi:hypothetical protein
VNIPGLTTAKRASGAIAARRLLVNGSSAGLASQGSGAAALLIGVSTDIDSDDGEPVDVVRAGLAAVEYGAAISLGAPLTSDSQGRAIALSLPVTASSYIIGFAEIDGAEGDIGSVHINPQLFSV